MTLPPDFVLREVLETRLESKQQVIDFTAAWGLLGGEGPDAFKHHPRGDATDAVQRQIQQWEPGRIHPEAVVLHHRLLQLLSRHVLAHLEGAGDDALVALWRAFGRSDIRDAQSAWVSWQIAMITGSRPSPSTYA